MKVYHGFSVASHISVILLNSSQIYPVSFDLGLDIIVFCIDLVSVFPFTDISHSEITFIPEFHTEVRKGIYSKAENFGIKLICSNYDFY